MWSRWSANVPLGDGSGPVCEVLLAWPLTDASLGTAYGAVRRSGLLVFSTFRFDDMTNRVFSVAAACG